MYFCVHACGVGFRFLFVDLHHFHTCSCFHQPRHIRQVCRVWPLSATVSQVQSRHCSGFKAAPPKTLTQDGFSRGDDEDGASLSRINIVFVIS